MCGNGRFVDFLFLWQRRPSHGIDNWIEAWRQVIFAGGLIRMHRILMSWTTLEIFVCGQSPPK